MVRAEDVKRVNEKPYNSILPYLRSKEQEERKKPSIKLVTKANQPDYTQNDYDKARQEILAEE